MLQEQVIPVDFGQGLDTKTDPKMVMAGRLLQLQNAVFTADKRLQKRNGYTALTNSAVDYFGTATTLVAPQMIKNYNNELICADQGQIFSYSKSNSKWYSRGLYTSTEISRTGIDQSVLSSGFVDCAVNGNYTLYAWSTGPSNIGTTSCLTFIKLVDNQTGTVIVESRVSSNSNTFTQPRCVILGGSVLAVIYANTAATALVSRTITTSGVVSAETTITTGLVTTGGMIYDIVATSIGASISYVSSTGVTVSNLNTSGAVSSSTIIVDSVPQSNPISISQTSNGNLWIYWLNAANTIVYSVLSSALANVLSKTTVVSGSSSISNMITINTSATAQVLYYSSFQTTGDQTDTTSGISTTSTGTIGSAFIVANGVAVYSRAFQCAYPTYNTTFLSGYYSVFIYRGVSAKTGLIPPTQATFFIAQLPLPVGGLPDAQAFPIVSRFASGIASSLSVIGVNTNRTGTIAYTPSVASLSATKFVFSCGILIQEDETDVFEGSQPSPSGGFVASNSYTIDFNSPNSYIATLVSNVCLLNGSVIVSYDGLNSTEFGFHLFPEIQSAIPQAGAGGIANGTYQYLVIFQWTDANGNLNQSAPSLATSVTMAGANNQVLLKITSSYLSYRNAVAAIFRTQNNGSIFYQVNDPNNPTPAGPFNSISFTDALADASLPGNPQAYTYPSSQVLENSTPPPSMLLCSHNNRTWIADSENRNTLWYSKSYSPLVAISPSAFLVENIDPRKGNISSLYELDDKLVIFKQFGVDIQSGDGANDTGTGSTLSLPQSLPSDVGCVNQKSIVSSQVGLFFQTPNGIYLLDRSIGISYKGMPVEQFNSQTITSAQRITGVSQIRFLVSSGSTIVYDYIFDKWSTFTNHIGLSSTSWNNVYIYANSSGLIFQETPGTYTDNGSAFAMQLQTSWMTLGSIQNFQRVRRLILLGDYANGSNSSHSIQITASYDFVLSNSSFPIPFTFGAISTNGVFQYRERLPKEKCDSISLLIQEVTTGDSAEYIDLSNIAFEAYVKTGVNKLSQGNTAS